MGKVISLPHFTKQKALTPLMLKTLRHACKKQNNYQPMGQIDLDGSFTSLLKRGLIGFKIMDDSVKKERSWYVTKLGINTLKQLGFDEPC